MSALDELIADVERLASSVIEVKIDGEIYGVPISSIGKLLAIVKCMREGLKFLNVNVAVQPASEYTGYLVVALEDVEKYIEQIFNKCERLAGEK